MGFISPYFYLSTFFPSCFLWYARHHTQVHTDLLGLYPLYFTIVQPNSLYSLGSLDSYVTEPTQM